MGYTHYWRQKREFTADEWQLIIGEAKRICAKAQRGDYYTGPETFKTAQEAAEDKHGFRVGFAEPGAWRTFPHPEIATPMQGAGIALADGSGEPNTSPHFGADHIGINGRDPEAYESFIIKRQPEIPSYYDERRRAEAKRDGVFQFCKTEYRPYDAVVVSVLDAVRTIAPDAITLSSDGGPGVFRHLF
jgi:hypothetical protein